MKFDADVRLENVIVDEAEGEPSSAEDMADWLLRVLSGGNVGAYALDVFHRAEAQQAKEVPV